MVSPCTGGAAPMRDRQRCFRKQNRIFHSFSMTDRTLLLFVVEAYILINNSFRVRAEESVLYGVLFISFGIDRPFCK